MEDPTSIQSYSAGDFSFITRDSERKMLADAFNGISRVEGGWQYLSRPDVPKKDSGFMFNRDPIINHISQEIDKDNLIGHSGYTYSWTMRQMEFIAKNGWHAYVTYVLDHKYKEQKEQIRTQSNFTNACPCRAAQGLSGWCGVAGGGVPACDH